MKRYQQKYHKKIEGEKIEVSLIKVYELHSSGALRHPFFPDSRPRRPPL